MNILLELIITIIIVGILALLIIALIAWFCDGRCYPKIKLSEFIKLYYTNKESWNMYKFSVHYKENKGRHDHWGDTIYEYHAFRFGYFEFLAYTCWYRYNKYVESKEKDKAAYEAFRKVVYKDSESEE